MISDPVFSTNLAGNESVVLFQTFAHLADGGRTWRIGVRGVVFEPGNVRLRERIMLRLLQRAMQAPDDAINSDVFRSRIQGFIAGVEKGKRLAVRIGPRVYRLRKKTKRNGQFSAVLRLPVEEVDFLRRSGGYEGDWLKFEVVTNAGDERRFEGRAQCIPHSGLSIITDIDDTIKHTKVTCRRSLLENTFLKEFQAIEGMALLYRNWFENGAVFHYVSSSPWQLYAPLLEWCDREGFPPGAFHLRSFRLRDHMLRRMLLIRRPGKGTVIKSLLRTFPGRQFILIGDSGEADPEIYGALARKYPYQVQSVLIRELPERRFDPLRWAKAFRSVPAGRCRTFRHAEELQNLLPAVNQRAVTPLSATHFGDASPDGLAGSQV